MMQLFQKRQRAIHYTIHEPTLQLGNYDINFDLNTWCHLIINNRHMQVIKPTIRQTLLQGDKESKLKNRKEMFRVIFE